MESFTELQRRVFALYREKRFAEALQTLEGAASTLPDYARLTYWKACFLCLQGQSEAALQALQEGLERGLWYSQTRLADPDLAPIQGRPEFQAILEESERRSQTAQTSVQTKLRVFPPRYLDSSTPLLMAFHMKGANLEETAPHWVSAAERGAFVAVLQSDQLDGPNEYGWGDYPRAKQAAQKAFAVLKTQHPFNPDYVVMGGASQGAGLAVRLTLEAALPSRGFIAVVGAGPLEPLLPHVGPSVQKGLKGVFISGEQDRARPHLEKVHGEPHGRGLECRLETVPGLGHDYPADFAGRLEQSLRFITGTEWLS